MGKTQKILVVDDDRDLLSLLDDFLSERGFKVITLAEGSKAVETCLQEQPDLILLDIKMPDADGMEVLSELKSNSLTSHIPVLMLTAENTPSSQVEGLLTGADDYITKPFDINILYARILACMRKNLSITRTKKDQINLLIYLIRHYQKRGYEIYTRLLPDFPDHPDDWKGFIPDLIIKKPHKIRCFNFENSQSIREEAFLDRLKAMVTLSIEKDVEPTVIVRSKEAKKLVKEISREYGLPINIRFIRRHRRKIF